MGQAMTDRLSGLSTGNARGALLGAAVLAVVAVALVLTVTGVAEGEVVATLLFLPVFAAGLLAGRTAGYGAAGVATAIYILLRRGDLSGAGLANAGVLTLTRAGAYAVAGHVGALARTLVGAGDAASRPGAEARRAAPGRASRPGAVAWDEPWEAERSQARAHDDRTRPVLVGVGPSAPGASFAGGEDGYGDGPMTTSGGWPPERPHERAPDEHVGAHAGGWGDPADQGWPDGAGGWPAETRPAADDDWEAVQASWRRQNGLPTEDEPANGALPHRRGGGRDDWGAPQASAAPDPWGPPAPGPAGPPSDPWGTPPAHSAGPPSDPWGTPPANGAGRHADPWGTPPAHSAGPPSDPWGTPPAHSAGPPSDPWGTPPAHSAGPPSDPWGTAPANGAGRHSDPWGTPPAHSAGPETDPWGTPLGPAAPPAPDPWGGAPDAARAWDAPPEPQGAGGPWSGLSAGTWGGPGAGQTGPMWDDPAVSPSTDDPWGPPTGPPSGAVPAVPGWSAAAAGPAGRPVPPPAAPPPSAAVNLPAVDHETGLWTAKFLRDRLSAERARSRRSGRPFSLVLVQVPDGPLAQLPYRRQVTLLRELGYQFVAGGVVDHLVHVPDDAQHWFAVILPDTDRSGAQVLERRLRLGIGGYLSSRGLRLRDLESASLTAPDDDPAMGQIWEALIGPEDGGPESVALDY
jgi:hypothetical protein